MIIRPPTRAEHALRYAPRQRPTHVRHIVLGLTVAAYMITYMDRQIWRWRGPRSATNWEFRW